jgi:hypothetical protein
MLYGPIPLALIGGCLPRSAAVFVSRPITPNLSDSGLLVPPSCHRQPICFTQSLMFMPSRSMSSMSSVPLCMMTVENKAVAQSILRM